MWTIFSPNFLKETSTSVSDRHNYTCTMYNVHIKISPKKYVRIETLTHSDVTTLAVSRKSWSTDNMDDCLPNFYVFPTDNSLSDMYINTSFCLILNIKLHCSLLIIKKLKIADNIFTEFFKRNLYLSFRPTQLYLYNVHVKISPKKYVWIETLTHSAVTTLAVSNAH